jgi:hypothetical protein
MPEFRSKSIEKGKTAVMMYNGYEINLYTVGQIYMGSVKKGDRKIAVNEQEYL